MTVISPHRLKKCAEEMLNHSALGARGFNNMEATISSSNILTANFAYKQATSSASDLLGQHRFGTIIGFEAKGYITAHYDVTARSRYAARRESW